VILIGLCFGFLIYVGSTAEFESSALTSPIRMIWLLPVAGIAWYIPRYLEKNTIDLERKMIFEETSTRSLELLRLSE
jgi:4-hydroxybenzoate polyprenyltransferase